jgi:hypothetical protein
MKVEFYQAGVPEAESSSRFLLCDVANIGYKLSDFQRNLELVLSDSQISKLNDHVKRRIGKSITFKRVIIS